MEILAIVVAELKVWGSESLYEIIPGHIGGLWVGGLVGWWEGELELLARLNSKGERKSFYKQKEGLK